jgi:hypothetical protein
MACLAHALHIVALIGPVLADWYDVIHLNRRLALADHADRFFDKDDVAKLHPSAPARAFFVVMLSMPAH